MNQFHKEGAQNSSNLLPEANLLSRLPAGIWTCKSKKCCRKYEKSKRCKKCPKS